MNEIDARKSHFNELANMSLAQKVEWAEFRIREFLEWCDATFKHQAVISFSGGKDSTALMDLVLKTHGGKYLVKLFPVYAMEVTYPETIQFIKDHINKLREKYPFLAPIKLMPPKKGWDFILNKYGYPAFSKQVSNTIEKISRANTKTNMIKYAFGLKQSAFFKVAKSRLFLFDRDFLPYKIANKCCDYIKGNIKHDTRPAFVGVMAAESNARKMSWINHGCNIFNPQSSKCRPLSLWNAGDVWEYIRANNIDINPVYGYDKQTHNVNSLRFERLGCSACPFGAHMEELAKKRDKTYLNRFEKLYSFNFALYQQQVIKNDLYRVLADMGITIKCDQTYMAYFTARQQQIKNWYDNFDTNLLRILKIIEGNPRNKTGWKFSEEEIKQIYNYYGGNYEKAKEKI